MGAPVLRRETMHEWPLSCVQSILLTDGRRLAYKSQLPPTVEPAFYARASSPLLPRHRLLGSVGACQVMVLEWIDAPLLRDVVRNERDLVLWGRDVVEAIGAIEGDPPVYVDAGSVPAWAGLTEVVLQRLGKLVTDGWFASVSGEQVAAMRTWAASAPVLAAVSAAPRLIHGDLKADQVFVTDGGYRVIDWQRPVLAPPDVDLVSLLVDRRIDPAPHVAAPVVGVFWFLRLHWAVVAQVDLFPDSRWPLFDHWAGEAVRHILSADRPPRRLRRR